MKKKNANSQQSKRGKDLPRGQKKEIGHRSAHKKLRDCEDGGMVTPSFEYL